MRFRLEGENRAAPGSGAATTCEEAHEVRWFSDRATGENSTITVTNASGTVLGSVRVNGTDSGVIVKAPSDKMYASSTSILFTPVNTRIK